MLENQAEIIKNELRRFEDFKNRFRMTKKQKMARALSDARERREAYGNGRWTPKK